MNRNGNYGGNFNGKGLKTPGDLALNSKRGIPFLNYRHK